MVRYAFIILMILICAVSSAAVECDQELTNSTILEEDITCLTNGIIIKKTITLDCNNHKIQGNNLGNGITIGASNVLVKNCDVSNFENGLFIENSKKVRVFKTSMRKNTVGAFIQDAEVVLDGRIADNTPYGVYLKNAHVMLAAAFENNVQDIVNLSKEQVQEIPVNPRPKEVELTQENTKAESAAEELNVLPLYMSSLELGDIEKTATIKDGATYIEVKVTAKKDIEKAVLIETIPKELASSADQISSTTPFVVLEQDPVIRFNLGDLKQGESKVIVYKIDKAVLKKLSLSPTSLLLADETFNPKKLPHISFFFAVLLINLAVLSYLKWKNKTKVNRLYELIAFIAGIIIFFLFNIQIEVFVSYEINNIIVTAGLLLANIYLITKIIHYWNK